MAVKKKTYHSAQGAKVHALTGTDLMVIAQPDSSALEGYRTVNTTVSLATDAVLSAIRNTPNNGLINIDTSRGIIGDGSISNPIQVDLEYFRRRWAFNQYTNISQVGNVSSLTLPIVKDTGFVFKIGSDIPVYLGGVNGALPAQSINLRTYFTVVANSTFYLYVQTVAGKIGYKLSTIAQPERYDLTYVATILTNATAVNTITAKPFMRLGNYRLSETMQGSSIPVSAGNPIDVAYPSWGGQGTITPIRAGIDPTKWTGKVSFDTTVPYVYILQDGQFWIQNKEAAVSLLGGFYITKASGGVKGAMGYLNGVAIWKGKGTVYPITPCNNIVREGWNTVHMEWGDLRIQGPMLK